MSTPAMLRLSGACTAAGGRPQWRWRTPAPAIAAAVLLLAGCSALQIDVDVYKGPLTNDETVQLRQYVALAIAAKPVLVWLRDDIERNGAPPSPSDATQDDFDPRRRFVQRSAGYANGVLSFYADLVPADVAQALQAFEDLQQLTAQFGVGPGDAALGERIGAALRNMPPADAARRGFACAYLQIVGNASRAECPPSATWRDSANNADRRFIGRLFDVCVAAVPKKAAACPADDRANIGYALLRDATAVRAHAQVIFGREDAAFESRIVQIADAFIGARQAMRSLWSAGLRVLDASDPAAPPLKRDAIATIIATATQTRTLACVLTRPAPSSEVAELQTAARISAASTPALLGGGAEWEPKRYEKADDALIAALKAAPRATAALLRLADAEAQSLPRSALAGCTALSHDDDQRQTTPLSARTFGLARGPALDKRFDEALKLLPTALQTVAGSGSYGWDRGRGPRGLESLQRDLLQALALHRNDTGQPAVREKIDALNEALIPFAERLLFVVNNSQLFPNDDRRVERSLLQTLGNTLLLHANDLRRRRVHEEGQRRGFAGELKVQQEAFDNRAAPQALKELLRQADLAAAMGVDAAKSAAGDVERRQAQLARAVDTAATAALERKAAALAAAAVPVPPPGLLAAHRTLGDADGSVRSTALQLPPAVVTGEADAAQNDRLAIDARVAQLDATPPVAAKAVLKAIVDWLKAEGGRSNAIPRQARLNAARAFLESTALQTDDLTGTAKVVFAAIRGRIGRQVDEVDAAASAAAKRLADAGTASSAAAAALADTRRALDAARKTAEAATADSAGAAAGRAVLADQRDAALAAADKAGITTAEGVRAAVLQQLSAALAVTKPGDPRRPGIDQALALVRGATLLGAFPFGAQHYAVGGQGGDQTKPPATQLQVLDDTIGLLRSRRIAALAEGRVVEAKQLLTAIDAAYDQRSGMVFLRPASDYLRNVYSATALQDEAEPVERNMLLDWLRRLLRTSPSPNVGTAAVTGGGEAAFNTAAALPAEAAPGDIRAARRELEKLFWQNINRVTLAGGASTNYVVAKDDVGNWYIKTYGADPQAVFNSAKSLALFNRGAKLDTNLLRRAELRQQADHDADPAKRAEAQGKLTTLGTAASPALLEFTQKTQKRFADGYFADTQRDAGELSDQARVVVDKLQAVWAKEFKADVAADQTALAAVVKGATDLQTATVEPARQRLADAVTKKVVSEAQNAGDIGKEATALLDTLRRFRLALDTQLQQQAELASDEARRTKLQQAVRRDLRALIDDAARRRQRTLDGYLDALTTLGDVASAPASK